MILFLVSICNF